MATHTIASGSKSVVYGPLYPPPAQTIVNNSVILTDPALAVSDYGSEHADDAITIYSLSGMTLVNSGTFDSTYSGLGPAYSPGFGVYFKGYNAGQVITITNTSTGVMEETGGNGYGVYLSGGNLVNAGFISGGPTAGKYAAGAGVKVGYLGVSITNSGTIAGGGIQAHSLTTLVNTGKVLGRTTSNSQFGAVDLMAGGIITNLATGTILAENGTYGVRIAGAAGTVTNAGYISNGSSGGDAVTLATGFTNLVVVDPGAKFKGIVDGGAAASSTLELGSGASVGTLSGFGSEYIHFGTLTFAPSARWLFETNTANIPGVINGFVQGDTIDITGFTAMSMTTQTGNKGVVLTSGSTQETISFGGAISNFHYTTGSFGTELTTICFCVGTLIDTPNGEVQVEKLRSGDIVSTAHNGPRKVTWVGQGKVLATRGRRSAATPVIVRKGALAPNVPHEDLRVTKAHALYIDDVLIPVEFLVNHKTILWDDRAQEVEIYHVELESQDVLIANGAPAESYRDDGNRWLFQNANSGWDLPPQEPYAPVLTGGPVVDAVWQRLLDRAGPRHLPPLTRDPDLHLIVDGMRVEARKQSAAAHIFRLPSHPKSVVIGSRAATPAELGFTRDPRSLGVALRRVTIHQGTKFMLIDADDKRLTAGFHDYEPAENIRWTNGYAELPVQAFARFDEGAEVVVHLGGSTRYPDDGDEAATLEACGGLRLA